MAVIRSQKWITLEDNSTVSINQPVRNGTCQRCGASFIWSKRSDGSWMPIEFKNGKYQKHSVTCTGGRSYGGYGYKRETRYGRNADY